MGRASVDLREVCGSAVLEGGSVRSLGARYG